MDSWLDSHTIFDIEVKVAARWCPLLGSMCAGGPVLSSARPSVSSVRVQDNLFSRPGLQMLPRLDITFIR